MRKSFLEFVLCVLLCAFSVDQMLANGTQQQDSDIAALSRILAAIATELDALETRTTQLGARPNIHTEIDSRQPIVFSREDVQAIQTELQRLNLGQVRIGRNSRTYRLIANLDHFLSVARAKYDEIKNHHSDDPFIPQVEAAFDTLLQRRRLRPIISTALRTGVVFTDMTSEGDFTATMGEKMSTTGRSMSSSILWETAHWGHGKRDISIRGQFG